MRTFKQIARSWHYKAVRHSAAAGGTLSAKNQERLSDAYLESFGGQTFAQVRGPNFQKRLTAGTVFISEDIITTVLGLDKKSSENKNRKDQGESKGGKNSKSNSKPKETIQ